MTESSQTVAERTSPDLLRISLGFNVIAWESAKVYSLDITYFEYWPGALSFCDISVKIVIYLRGWRQGSHTCIGFLFNQSRTQSISRHFNDFQPLFYQGFLSPDARIHVIYRTSFFDDWRLGSAGIKNANYQIHGLQVSTRAIIDFRHSSPPSVSVCLSHGSRLSRSRGRIILFKIHKR